MELHNMKPTLGSRKARKRVGRGDKTAGRGENGQKSRSGFKNKIGFEGGQNPLYRRIPKRGFTNYGSKLYKPVNLDSLGTLEVAEVTREALIDKGVIKAGDKLYKILGNGEVTMAFKVHANKFSKSAKVAIEKAGGEAIEIPGPKEHSKKSVKKVKA